MALVEWNQIDGVPVHYSRDQTPSLRNPGTRRTWRSTPDFKAKLDAMFAELWANSGLGKASIIVTSGALVNKPGMHGKGRAFDLDGIVWAATDTRPEREFYCIDYDTDAAFYWGVGGILNRHMRYVLHAMYNANHRDHYHIDDSRDTVFTSGSSSAVQYLQAAITHVYAIPIRIDGDAGPQTRNAVQAVLDRLGISGSIEDRAVWAEFNLRTARLGMGATTTGSTPEPEDDEPSEPEDITPSGDHEQPVDSPASASFRLRLRTPRMRGKKVRQLQRALKKAGYDVGKIDGIFGSRTSQAVKDFQRANGLDVDGVVGPKTARRLKGFRIRPRPRPPVPPIGPMTEWPSIPVRSRRQHVMKVLTEKYGYPVNAAAGIVGNLEAESGVIPNRIEGSTSSAPMTSVNNAGVKTEWTAEQIMNRVKGVSGPKLGGVGLAQWTFHTRREALFEHEFEASDGGGPDVLFDMDAQIDFIVEELGSRQFRTKVDKVLRAADVDVVAASDVMLFEYERPADMGDAQRDKRRAFSTKARDEFTG